jgi:serine/threonine protein kinase
LLEKGFPSGLLQSLADLAEGCDHMAGKGILHRDLTLDNILITLNQSSDSVTLKLCDFGVSGTPEDY